jgi:hypothetical protein
LPAAIEVTVGGILKRVNNACFPESVSPGLGGPGKVSKVMEKDFVPVGAPLQLNGGDIEFPSQV